MEYAFENLGADRFQQFCQALLMVDYPDLQCFPVGQPDGGRDAVSRETFVVGQVKFKKLDEGESADWMIKALEAELPKINRLIKRGATRYIMMTNARGTAHLDAGRIDLVQTWLDENVSIPAQCLWRDELSRKLDLVDAVKLAYPALLNGEAALTLIVNSQFRKRTERITRALRAFVGEQFRRDENVKFRQLELENSLLGLFVDVPVHIPLHRWNQGSKALSSGTYDAFARLAYRRKNGILNFGPYGETATAGAAEVLLDAQLQSELPWIVLHGAPGQGKSTLAQYVCQVHRAQYLNKTDFLSMVPAHQASSSFRLPIKVDLRDLAAYLDGQQFLKGPAEPIETTKSLEQFLAAAIFRQSGGLKFNADDLAETLSRVPTLLFFDGLDEVADLDLRLKVVNTVRDGLNRLRENGAKMQVVVTSRPSLFGRAPKFSDDFVPLSLAEIGVQTINEYAEKWMVARKLDEERALEVRGILREKLELGHIRDLTRNPMQLTILLSLILSVGYSLPEMRTDLYKSYVDLFMTREAEKSPIVREHRPILLKIVEYLAWVLQSGAESDRSSGSVSRDDLRALVSEFLEREETESDILDDLFTGGLERVYVLVQRVEGLFEFEVQPLREYFAAKYLYSSTPNTNFRHQQVSGDRAQRFEAMAANPYWANVTRFYCGFYQQGEIGSLIVSLKELIESADLGISLSARGVGAALLSDWVFRPKKYVQDEVIRLVFDDVGVRLASLSRLAGFENVALDKQCGRATLARILLEEHLMKAEPVDHNVCFLLRRNGGELLTDQLITWSDETEEGAERVRRLIVGLASGAFSSLQKEQVEAVFSLDGMTDFEASSLLRGLMMHEPFLLKSSKALSDAAVASVLRWGGVHAVDDGGPAALATLLAGGNLPESLFLAEATSADADYLVDLRAAVAPYLSEARYISRDGLEAGPVSAVIEACRDHFGDTWATYRLAIVSISYKATLESGSGTSLIAVASAARLRRGKSGWWAEKISSTRDLEQLFWLGMMLAWAPSRAVAEQLRFLDATIERLDVDDFERLLDVLDSVADVRGGRARNLVNASDVHPRTARALVAALGSAQLGKLSKALLDEPNFKSLVERWEIERGLASRRDWTPNDLGAVLDLFARAWKEDVLVLRFASEDMRDPLRLPREISDAVMQAAGTYSPDLVEMSRVAIQQDYWPVPVRLVSEKEDWTFS